MKNFGYNALMNYIDDLIYIGLLSKIHETYHKLLSLLDELGLEVSQPKLVHTCTSVVKWFTSVVQWFAVFYTNSVGYFL